MTRTGRVSVAKDGNEYSSSNLQPLAGRTLFWGGGWHGSPFASPPPSLVAVPGAGVRAGGALLAVPGGGGGRPLHTWLKMIPTLR